MIQTHDKAERKKLRELNLCYRCRQPLSAGCGGIRTCKAPPISPVTASISKAVHALNPKHPQDHLNMLLDWVAEEEVLAHMTTDSSPTDDVNALLEEAQEETINAILEQDGEDAADDFRASIAHLA